MKCEDCAYFHEFAGPHYHEDGQCRRYPPSLNGSVFIETSKDQAIDQTAESAWWDFPVVDRESWCGEFKQK